MTKKDYILIAKKIKSMVDYTKLPEYKENRGLTIGGLLERFIVGFAIDLKQDNKRFDIEKFYDACGLPVGLQDKAV